MHRRLFLILPAALLAGCAGVPDDNAARLLVAPDQYVLYDCPQLAAKAKEIAERQRKLEQLMARASTDSGGRLVNALAYRPDYLVARGEMYSLRQTALEKNCNFLAGGEGNAVALPPPSANRPPARAR